MSYIILSLHGFTRVRKGYVRQFLKLLSPRLIIVNREGPGELYIDLYGIVNPHLWLLTTTSIRVMGDNCLNSFITSEKRCAGNIGHTSSIIRLTVTTNGIKSKQWKHVFKYGFILM